MCSLFILINVCFSGQWFSPGRHFYVEQGKNLQLYSNAGPLNNFILDPGECIYRSPIFTWQTFTPKAVLVRQFLLAPTSVNFSILGPAKAGLHSSFRLAMNSVTVRDLGALQPVPLCFCWLSFARPDCSHAASSCHRGLLCSQLSVRFKGWFVFCWAGCHSTIKKTVAQQTSSPSVPEDLLYVRS